MSRADERYEEQHEVVRLTRLENSPAGNARWEFEISDRRVYRTAHDSHAGAEMTGIVDGIREMRRDGRWIRPEVPVPVVLTFDGYRGVRGVREDRAAPR